ncbi:NUDIX domain-containing protein [Nonomuraea sp. NPDC049504]|uniref:NUDIX hydrolase n=1 Tax=Nonomuraea sp. NPDC049504 TaxID=3154729 RepID=UPI003447D698
MIRDPWERGLLEAAAFDAESATLEFDQARSWLRAALDGPMEPLGAEVWVLDPGLEQILLVQHPWRGLVPPGGKVEPGESPRQGAARELAEECGLRPQLLDRPAAVAVRSFHPDLPLTLSLSYAAIADPAEPLTPEPGQPALWHRLDGGWAGFFPQDPDRVRQHVKALRSGAAA